MTRAAAAVGPSAYAEAAPSDQLFSGRPAAQGRACPGPDCPAGRLNLRYQQRGDLGDRARVRLDKRPGWIFAGSPRRLQRFSMPAGP
jgi:hypothetical protein